jgi:serine/threonine protein phosphatase PrpC
VEAHLRRIRGRDSVRTAILDALDEANRAIISLGIGAGTTVAIAEIEEDRIRGYHVGDSAILAVGQRGRVKLRTLCHAPTAYAVESGLLDEAEALHHADRHLVSNVVGRSRHAHRDRKLGAAIGARHAAARDRRRVRQPSSPRDRQSHSHRFVVGGRADASRARASSA